MKNTHPEDQLRGDPLTRDNLRHALNENLDKLNFLVAQAETAEDVDTATLGKTLQSIRSLRDSFIKVEAKIAEEKDPNEFNPKTQIDFDAARDEISRRLDRLRESLGPKEVSG